MFNYERRMNELNEAPIHTFFSPPSIGKEYDFGYERLKYLIRNLSYFRTSRILSDAEFSTLMAAIYSTYAERRIIEMIDNMVIRSLNGFFKDN